MTKETEWYPVPDATRKWIGRTRWLSGEGMERAEEDATKMSELARQIAELSREVDDNVLMGALILTMGRMIYDRLAEEGRENKSSRDTILAGIIKGVDRVVLDAIEEE